MSVLKIIDTISEWMGKIFGWLSLMLVLVVVYGTFMRYFFSKPPVWAFETSVFIYAGLFMLGISYTHLVDAHCRIDVFVTHSSLRTRVILDLLSYLVFFFPFVIILIINSTNYAAFSWERRETSFFPWHPPIYPFKALIPVAFSFLFLQGLADFIRKIRVAVRGKA